MFKSDLIVALQYKLLRSKQALCKIKKQFLFNFISKFNKQKISAYIPYLKKKKKKAVGNIDNVGGKPVRDQRSVTAPVFCTVWFDTLQRHGVDPTLNGLSFLPGALLEIL